MGWFDSDNKERQQTPQRSESPAAPAAVPAATPTRPVRSGSTVGARMKVTGTIVSDEDLEIVGQVEGEIRARETLSIARDAEVRAVVHGRRIVLEGALHGDIHASEVVVLGAGSTMQGDIHTPSLEIREGALFRGSVKMKSAQEREARPDKAGARASASGAGEAKAAGSRPGDAGAKGAAVNGQQKLPATSSAG